jgi:hypothetical protein
MVISDSPAGCAQVKDLPIIRAKVPGQIPEVNGTNKNQKGAIHEFLAEHLILSESVTHNVNGQMQRERVV